MSARHFLSDPQHAVLTALKSQTLTNPSILFDEPNKILYRHPASIADPAKKVALICGGGSGHEPAYVGYVGRGGLTACVAGTVFASPSAEQVRACVARRLPRDAAGILVIVMNYTGDVLNFGMGAEKARAMGREVEMIVVGDDVGVGRAKGGKVGRRGIAGATMAVKVCGAAADMGVGLADTARVGRLAGDNVVAVATSLARVHVLGKDAKDAEEEAARLPPGTMELGMGIHNEPGCEQLATDLPGIVKKMLAQLLDPNDTDRYNVKFAKGDQVVLQINNFGGVSNLELGAITTEVFTQLGKDWDIRPVRVYSGVFNGSLNGLGFGIALLRLADTGLGPGKSMLELLDAPCEIVGWPAPIKPETFEAKLPAPEEKAVADEESQPSNVQVDPGQYAAVLTHALQRVIAAEPLVTRYDSIVGDGDCGTGLKRGAEAILALLSAKPPTADLARDLAALVNVVENTMDGTSGAIYAIFLNALEAGLRAAGRERGADGTPADAKLWAAALTSGLTNLERYTPAKPGDRTLMDALCPFVETLRETGDIGKAAAAGVRGAEGTKGMKASLGRTVYVGGSGWQDIPDPGAYGLAEFLKGLAEGCEGKRDGKGEELKAAQTMA